MRVLAWLSVGLLVTALPTAGAEAGLEFYNRSDAGRIEAELAAARQVPVSRRELLGWGKLVVEPSAAPGRLAALEEAAPLGFSRADVGAAVTVPCQVTGTLRVAGVLAPVGLAFDQRVEAKGGLLRIPLPAAVLPAGDYTLKVLVSDGQRTEAAALPLIVGPYLHLDRYHTYYWSSGINTAEASARQVALAGRLGLSVVDSPYLPAPDALRAGLLVSAHLVSVHASEVKEGYAAVEPFVTTARAKAETAGWLARRYRNIRFCIPNSEYGAAALSQNPAFLDALKQDTGLDPASLRWRLPADLKPGQSILPVLADEVTPVAPFVWPHDLPELRAYAFAAAEGQGWFRLNRLTADIVRQQAPQVTAWLDPVVTNEQFTGLDAVSFWDYAPGPWHLLWSLKRGDAARRLSGARAMYLTTSQWYLGVATTREGKGADAVFRSPDQHRTGTWLAVAEPTDMCGFWAVEQVETEPACAEGLAAAMREVAEPYGTLLRGTEPVAPPVAVYLSSAGEFLGRGDRPYNYWYRFHYLNGLMPALVERFHNRLVVVDDADVLAGRLAGVKLLLCPCFRATTDRLRDALAAWQKAGGVLVGDEHWRIDGLTPDELFPGKTPKTLGITYRNETLAQWHQVNRDAVLAWQPKGAAEANDALTSPTRDVALSLRRDGGTLYAVAANVSARRGAWADKFQVTDPRYLDEGQEIEATVSLRVPAGYAFYDAARSREVAAGELRRDGDRVVWTTLLPPAGAVVLVAVPRPIGQIALACRPDRPRAGQVGDLTIRVLDDRGQPMPGRTAVRVELTDPGGARHDASGIHPVLAGEAHLPFGIDLDAKPGTWTATVNDLISGRRATMTITATGR